MQMTYVGSWEEIITRNTNESQFILNTVMTATSFKLNVEGHERGQKANEGF